MRSLLTWQQLIKMNGVKKWKLINGNFHHRHTHQCEREENGKKYYVKEERESSAWKILSMSGGKTRRRHVFMLRWYI